MGSNESTQGNSRFSVDPKGNVSYPSDAQEKRRVPEMTPPVVEEPKVEPKIIPPTPTPSPSPTPKSNYSASKMAYKSRIFEDIERNLTLCYKTNKDQPIKCADLSRDYKSLVDRKGSQLLKESMNIPLATSVLFVIACLLLHITTVSCFGAMSIDLGSEWMKVGLVAPNVPMDIVLNAQSQRKTPMAIAFSNSERFIGDSAQDIASKYPERSYTHFLDLVGKSIDHPSVEHYRRRFPHANITSHEPNSTSILLNHPEGPNFTPLELLTMMIQHAHDQVVSRLSNDELASDVVITVPPFFEAQERRVVEQAAKLAGLNLLRLTNVNSAFALSYGLFRHKDYQPKSSDGSNGTSILFFDQGASHTSVTIADYHLAEQFDETTGLSKNESLPTITIRAQAYDRYLGGFDMQLRLRDHLVKTFAKSNNIDEQRIMQRGKSAAKLLKEAGRVKKVLSANTDYLVRVENVIDDKDMRLPITRQEFEDMNQDYLLDRTTNLLDRLFSMPNVSRSDSLESVIIVGGNTRTPKIQQVLTDYFKLETLGKSINADEGAALSALYQAASLGRGFRVKKFVLEESLVDAPEEKPDIYNETELERAHSRLVLLKNEDSLRLQRLSLRNSLESLVSEALEKIRAGELKEDDESVKIVSETQSWLEDESQQDNLTALAHKIDSIHNLIHPIAPQLPPPPPPPHVEL